MTVIFIDGFDKYAQPQQTQSNGSRLGEVLAGEWTSLEDNTASIVSGLSSRGYAISLGVLSQLSKTLASAKAQLIGGFRFKSSLASTSGITFKDGSTSQCSITINTDGTISLRQGSFSGTVVATGGIVSANSTHYLEFDLTFDNSGAYDVYLDGVSLYSGTADLEQSTNAQATSIMFNVNAGNAVLTIDDMYLFDASGGTNNAILGTSPVVETSFPSADGTVQFSVGAAAIGYFENWFSNSSPGANKLVLVPITPKENVSIDSVSLLPAATSGGAKYKAVLYDDSAGIPGSRVATGTETVGATSGTTLTSAFGSPQSLTGGTQYWIGYITDTSVAVYQYDNSHFLGLTAANTYGSGAPATAPAMSSGNRTWCIWGNLSSVNDNYQVISNPTPGFADVSYLTDSTSTQQDTYTTPNLSINPGSIYTVAVKGFTKKSDSGARTASFVMNSGTATGTGDNAGQALAEGYQWQGSNFETDPNTSSAWGTSALNSAKIGFKVAS